VTRPKVLLLDEPLGALDKHLRQEMQVELRRIQRQVGITTDLRDPRPGGGADALRPDRDLRFRAHHPGRRADGVYERPVTRFAAGFLGEANFLLGRVTAMEAGGLARVALDIGGEASCRLSSGQAGQTGVAGAAAGEDHVGEPTAKAGLNAVRGKVLDVVFSGNSTTYRSQSASR
jgi:ABC-type Fe3+/spermidine/putrescine transport system ATPase subunit